MERVASRRRSRLTNHQGDSLPRSRLVMLPSNSPVFIRARQLHDELFARKLIYARQVFAYQGAHQCAVNMILEGSSAFVDLICATWWPVPITSESVRSDGISASSLPTGRTKSVPSA
jgi:hypothetical protein